MRNVHREVMPADDRGPFWKGWAAATLLGLASAVVIQQACMLCDRVRRLEHRLEAAEFRVQMHQETIDVCRGDLGVVPAGYHLSIWEGGNW